jgi:GAF domain-containing protein
MQADHDPLRSVGDELAAVHARLAGILLTEQTMETALQLITSLATDTLAGSLGSGVTLMRADGLPATSAATDPLVDTLDQLQYELGEGPCLTAWAATAIVRSDDLTAEDRWPTWSRRAAQLDMRAVLSAPLEAGGASFGAVKVYSSTPAAYDERSEDLLRRFADQAAIFVSNVHTAQTAQRIGDELKKTLWSRDVIATARGIVMARKGLDSDGANRQLFALARRARIPLRELAERIVAAAPARPDAPRDL